MNWLKQQTYFEQLPTMDFAPINVINEIDATLGIVEAAFFGVGIIMLLVGAMGVLNIGLATLKERSDELALRRSLGATKFDVAVLVLAESIIIGIAGSFIAICISLAAYTPIMTATIKDQTTAPFPIAAAGLGIVAGIIAGACGGIVPAWKSANMPIASVMRA